MWNSLIVLSMITFVQVGSWSWGGSGENSLSQWRPVGRPVGSIPMENGALVLWLNREDVPHSIVSPHLGLAPQTFDTVQLSYSWTPLTAEVTVLVGWIGRVIGEHRADACAVRGVLTPTLQDVELNLRASPCWAEEREVNEVVLNFTASGLEAENTVLQIRRISLVKRAPSPAAQQQSMRPGVIRLSTVSFEGFAGPSSSLLLAQPEQPHRSLARNVAIGAAVGASTGALTGAVAGLRSGEAGAAGTGAALFGAVSAANGAVVAPIAHAFSRSDVPRERGSRLKGILAGIVSGAAIGALSGVIVDTQSRFIVGDTDPRFSATLFGSLGAASGALIGALVAKR